MPVVVTGLMPSNMSFIMYVPIYTRIYKRNQKKCSVSLITSVKISRPAKLRMSTTDSLSLLNENKCKFRVYIVHLLL